MRFLERSKILRGIISNDEDIEDKVLRIIIYTNDFDYEYVSESESVLLVNLIANIGGTLGLFLGVSVLSFCEIFEILMENIFFEKSKIKKKTTNSIKV